MWLSLKENWKAKAMENDEDRMKYGVEGIDWGEKEDGRNWEEKAIDLVILNTMFRNVENKPTPKQRNRPGDNIEEILKVITPQENPDEREGEGKRPDQFPKDLWDLVHPSQKKWVQGRFDKFEDKEYLKECVDKILKELDILHRQEEKIEWEEQEIIGNDDKLMRAQALANIDAYFFPDPNTAVLAKDVVAEINTTDERPMRCRPRKLSVVQQAF